MVTASGPAAGAVTTAAAGAARNYANGMTNSNPEARCSSCTTKITAVVWQKQSSSISQRISTSWSQSSSNSTTTKNQYGVAATTQDNSDCECKWVTVIARLQVRDSNYTRQQLLGVQVGNNSSMTCSSTRWSSTE
jgi:isocitrate dehydrogenase